MARPTRIAWLAVALALAGAPAIAADADILREAQDRVDINQLEWNYVRAIDSFNENAYADVFTPDGTFNAVKGSDALRKMVLDLKKSQAERRAKGETVPAMHHVSGNQNIRFADRDRAYVEYYWMTVFAGAPNAQPPRVAAAGRGIDEVVRVNGKWLIKSRNVAPKD